MSAEAPTPLLADPRRFRVVWQNPASRELVDVGRLAAGLQDGEPFYEFWYEAGAFTDPMFRPFPEFPNLRARYKSQGALFAFFSNRVMSAQRPDFDQYLGALGLARGEANPAEMLARSAGGRATDTIHVVPEPDIDAQGNETVLFLVSGVRHVPGASERIERLRQGDRLVLRDEPENEFNPRAILLDDATASPVGYVPNYLLDYVHKRAEDHRIDVHVEQANGAEIPWHLRLLCRLNVSAI